MGHIIKLTEEVANQLRDDYRMDEYKFMSNVRYFLTQLRADPVNTELPELLQMQGYTKPKFIGILRRHGIIERHEKISDKDENGRWKKATMLVTYNVPDEGRRLDRKIKKLYIDLFERNLPDAPKPAETDAEGGVCEAASCAGDGAGVFIGPASLGKGNGIITQGFKPVGDKI